MKYFFDLWIKLELKFYLQILIRSTDWILLLSADLILSCRYFLNLWIKFFLFTKNYLMSRSDSKQVISSTSYKSYVFCKTQEKVNSEQRWANKKKHSITYLFIKLPDVFMKKMKWKMKWKCISTPPGAIKIYLV